MTTIKRRTRATLQHAVMGIDQSYSGFAVCVITETGRSTVHRHSFDVQHYGAGVDRLNEIGAWFRRIITDTPQQLVHVCMEGYAPGAKFGREMAGELGAVVKIMLRLHPRLWDPACYPTIVTPTQVKQFATGKGQAKKEDMKLGAYKRWGVEFKSNDEVDAYVLAQMALAIAADSPRDGAAPAIQWQRKELTAYQQDVLNKLRYHTERQEDNDGNSHPGGDRRASA